MITTSVEGLVAVLTIDRHERRNALDAEHCRGLLQAAGAAVGDGARCVVLSGSASTFSAGADLDAAYDRDFLDALYGMLHGLTELPVPLIAAVNGPAIGAGTQLAIACDLRVVAATASFAVPTARNGLAVDSWTIRRLAALAGTGRAGALLVGCESLSAEESLASGLADRPGDLDTAVDWARRLSALAPLALAYNKKVLHEMTPTAPVLTEAFVACWDSADVREAQRARADKRQPVFEGR